MGDGERSVHKNVNSSMSLIDKLSISEDSRSLEEGPARGEGGEGIAVEA
jgi:hypothetical protein